MADKPNTEIKHRSNERGMDEHFVSGRHVDVDELKKLHKNQYTGKRVAAPDELSENFNTVPHYPRPVEFHLSEIAHVTTKQGMNGILDSNGFKGGKTGPGVEPCFWWGLVIVPEEITRAEERYLKEVERGWGCRKEEGRREGERKKRAREEPEKDEEKEEGEKEKESRRTESRDQAHFLPKCTTSPPFKDGSDYGNFPGAGQSNLNKVFPDPTEEERMRKMQFLEKFTTSPAFKDNSRYGNFRFSLPLREALQAYSTQFCDGRDPILRVWETVVYKQEIMYSVLVHSPDFHDYDKDYPEELGDNEEGVCAYRNGEIIWRAQAISATHKFRLIEDRHEKVSVDVFYVWDHVTLAFHIPDGKTLSFSVDKLVDCLTACDIERPKCIPDDQVVAHHEAKRRVQEIKNTKRE